MEATWLRRREALTGRVGNLVLLEALRNQVSVTNINRRLYAEVQEDGQEAHIKIEDKG